MLKDKRMKTKQKKSYLRFLKTGLKKQVKNKNNITALLRNKILSDREHSSYSWKSDYLTKKKGLR